MNNSINISSLISIMQNHPVTSQITQPDMFGKLSEHNYDSGINNFSKKIIKRRTKYHKIDDNIRMKLIEAVEKDGEMLKSAAKRLKVNYSSAKSIFQTYKKEGRVLRKTNKVRRTLKRNCHQNQLDSLNSKDQSFILIQNENKNDLSKIPTISGLEEERSLNQNDYQKLLPRTLGFQNKALPEIMLHPAVGLDGNFTQVNSDLNNMWILLHNLRKEINQRSQNMIRGVINSFQTHHEQQKQILDFESILRNNPLFNANMLFYQQKIHQENTNFQAFGLLEKHLISQSLL